MFHRLKLKLTLTNMMVVGLILLFFMAQVYLLTVRDISQQSAGMMLLIASQVSTGESQPINDAHHHHLNYFYVIVDRYGKTVSTFPNPLPPVIDGLDALIDHSLHFPQTSGTIKLHKESYVFQKAPIKNSDNMVLVFTSNEANEETLAHLLGALGITGAIALALVFFGGLFMAEKALIPIKSSWQRQKDFTADASHEMRTPLAIIQTNLDLVMGNQDKTVESQSKWLENIKTETKRMSKLVEDLLFLARADSDQETLNMEVFPLHLAVQEALRPLEPVAAGQSIELELDISPIAEFYGNEVRIKQLVVILIDNAIKYTPAGGKVKLELKNLERQVEIIISDTGEGIDQANLERIFERFYRVDKARSRKGGGTGLGLAIAQWIVTQHRGAIKASSTPGQGTTFRIVLPRSGGPYSS